MSRPTITLEPGKLPWIIDEVERAIRKNYAAAGLYQRGDFLVRAVTATPDDDPRKYVRRPAGAVILRAATAASLQDVFGREIKFVRNVKDGDDFKQIPVDCPAKIGTQYLSRTGLWHLPVLVGVVEAPLMRVDGSILTAPGYDESTGLLLQSSVAWRTPPSLSDEAVAAAVRCLKEPFAQFPLSPAGLAVVISGIITALQRRLLFSAPIHGIDAPSPGSGKTLLADCIALPATGRESTSISANAGDPEEFRKKLMSICIAGDAIVSIDNNTRPLANDTLATIVTVPNHSDRFMGGMTTVQVITNILWLATGNNLEFSGDMPSRVIVARIEPDCERPEERTFNIPDLREHILAHRVELVTAAMTIVQAYHFRKDEEPAVKPFGRFEEWSDQIRKPMIWAGFADPCETREAVIATDPERDAALALYEHWHRVLGGKAITIPKLIEWASSDFELKTALLDIAMDPKHPEKISSHILAWWCRHHVGRVIGDFKLSRGEKITGNNATWQVAQVVRTATVTEEQTAREI
jgi:hypothetical protein